MNRETVKIEFDNRQLEFYAKPTILEEQLIRDRAAEFTGGGLSKLIDLESSRNIHLEKCLKKDEQGNIIKGENDDSVKVDIDSKDFKMYAEYNRILENAYFFGIVKTLMINAPSDLDVNSLEGIQFYELKSAFEDALDSFRNKGRDTEAGKDDQGNTLSAQPAGK